ncbi:hypothetical protein ACFLRI_01810 [Bacteroidota bacterium]
MSDIQKFSLIVNEVNEEMYILHREFPSCLVHVERTTPNKFKLIKLYEDIEESEVFNHPFFEEMKAFFRKRFK